MAEILSIFLVLQSFVSVTICTKAKCVGIIAMYEAQYMYEVIELQKMCAPVLVQCSVFKNAC